MIPAKDCAVASDLNAAATARNQAFIVIVMQRRNKKKVLREKSSALINEKVDGEEHSQELFGRPLQANQEVQNDTEEGDGDKRDRDVDQGHRNRVNGRVIHSCLLMPCDDWTLSIERWNLGHTGQCTEQKSAAESI